MFSEVLVTLMVDDLARSVRFYQEGLGFELREGTGEESAELAGPGIRLRLHRRRPEIETHGSGTAAVGLRVPDVPTASRSLEDRGVHVGRILRTGTRRIALFDDPDGNHWYLFDPGPDPAGPTLPS